MNTAETSNRMTVAGIRQGHAKEYFHEIVDEIVGTLIDIEKKIEAINHVLDELQPPLTGRMQVMWINRGGYGARGYRDEFMPVMAIWSRSKLTHKWSAKKIPHASITRSVKSNGQFKPSHEQVKRAATAVQALMKLHVETRARLARLDGDWSRDKAHVARKITRAVDEAQAQTQTPSHPLAQ